MEQVWSFCSREIIFSLLSPSSEKSQFVITLPSHRNRPRKSDLQGILKLLLLPGSVLPPMERAIQVGTSMELLFSRNNIFPAFPVIPKIQFVIITASPPKLSAKVGFQGILKVFLPGRPALLPMERSIQVGTILDLWFSRNNIFPGFPVIPKITISSSHCLPTETLCKVLISGNLSTFLPGRPDLSPMERSVQVGTILQLWFRRNNIFPAFPVIPTIPNLSSHCLPKSDYRGILKVLLLPSPVLPPMERSIQVGAISEL